MLQHHKTLPRLNLLDRANLITNILGINYFVGQDLFLLATVGYSVMDYWLFLGDNNTMVALERELQGQPDPQIILLFKLLGATP